LQVGVGFLVGVATLMFPSFTLPVQADISIPYCEPRSPNAGWCFMVIARAGLRVHDDRRTDAPVVTTLPYGTYVNICQELGENVGGNSIWDNVEGVGFVSDYWMSTSTFGTQMLYPCGP
jgi:hypothetical protein